MDGLEVVRLLDLYFLRLQLTSDFRTCSGPFTNADQVNGGMIR